MKEPPKPICIQTPQEGVVSLITFHSGDETERKASTTKLLTVFDFNEEGNLKTPNISYTEMRLKELPDSLQEILKTEFTDITDDSFVIMRFFRDEGEGEWIPVFLHDEKEQENANG